MNNYSSAASAALRARARVGLAGATGYAGQQLRRLLARHAHVEVVAALDSSSAVEVMIAARPDLVFLATPAEVSAAWAPALRASCPDLRLVDLSPAFRFDADWVYGWPERNGASIRAAACVANPGCYATAANLALGPLLEAGAIAAEEIVCDAKSGASGAGRTLRADLQFCELAGNCKPYDAYVHRHAPEIARQTGLDASSFAFVPHLLPTDRGILATMYVRCRPGADFAAGFAAAYAGHPFVRVRGRVGGDDAMPQLRDVVHTNYCDLGWTVRADGKQAVVVSCLDNLIKGAAGQALQNANLMMGWSETEGLA
ncbi:MAG: N-acetyl-gamma-glutamyl-phosphate reductase [Terriglobales bacterium]